jgi:hypothetical protein
MAFTPAEKHSIAHVLSTTVTLLNAHITAMGATLDADTETAVRTELTRWETAGVDFVKIHPKEANFGVEINGTQSQHDIARKIALSLEWPYPVGSASMGTLQIG